VGWSTAQGFVDVLIATGLGILIGLEREHSDVEPGPGAPATEQIGVRTFALMSLFGLLCGMLEPAARGITAVGLAVASALIALHYVRTWQAGAGMTTEVAAVVTFGLGLLVHHARLFAVSLSLIITLLLIAKPWVRFLVARIDRRELLATLQLAIMLAIVLPFLPTEARDPWHVLAPRRIGLFVVLVVGISFVGYVLSRIFGPRRGAGLSGLVGGLASSTAVTAAMAERAHEAEAMVAPARFATFLANAVMFGRVLVVSAVLGGPIALHLAVPMGLMCAVVLGGAFWSWRSLRGQGEVQGGEIPLSNPFALVPALKWGALLAVTLVVTAVMKQQFGTRGLIVTAAVSGLADVDAINVAVSRAAAREALDLHLATLAITIGVVANTVTKGIIAWTSGGRAFGRPILVVFGIAVVVGLTAALVIR
jgi:uncharacterized membrane protein (DUF4010 family)